MTTPPTIPPTTAPAGRPTQAFINWSKRLAAALDDTQPLDRDQLHQLRHLIYNPGVRSNLSDDETLALRQITEQDAQVGGYLVDHEIHERGQLLLSSLLRTAPRHQPDEVKHVLECIHEHGSFQLRLIGFDDWNPEGNGSAERLLPIYQVLCPQTPTPFLGYSCAPWTWVNQQLTDTQVHFFRPRHSSDDGSAPFMRLTAPPSPS